MDKGHLYRIEDMKFIDGIPQFIKKWKDWGYKIVVVTNQAGIAKGYYTEKEMHQLHKFMNAELEKYSADIDAFYFCPYHPDFTGACDCRKPNHGMIKQALYEFNADPSHCILFGDKAWDIEAGERCRVKGILVNND